jgi:hypothetical protein
MIRNSCLHNISSANMTWKLRLGESIEPMSTTKPPSLRSRFNLVTENSRITNSTDCGSREPDFFVLKSCGRHGDGRKRSSNTLSHVTICEFHKCALFILFSFAFSLWYCR